MELLDKYWHNPEAVCAIVYEDVVSVTVRTKDGEMPGFVVRIRDGKIIVDGVWDK